MLAGIHVVHDANTNDVGQYSIIDNYKLSLRITQAMKCPLENYPLICHHRRMCVRSCLPSEILTLAQNATTKKQREVAAATIRNHLGTEKSFRLDTPAPCWSFLATIRARRQPSCSVSPIVCAERLGKVRIRG